MKKLIVMAVIAAFFSVGTSKGQTNQSDTKNITTSNRGQFVDKNNDGICDNFQNRTVNTSNRKYIDKNNDGICDNQQNRKANANGRNYVDKNNDGICDNKLNKVKSNNCCRQGWKHRRGNGCCRRNR